MNRDKEQQTSLDDDLTMLTDTLEEVLRASGDAADETYQEIKARAEKALKEVQNRLSGRSECYIKRAKAQKRWRVVLMIMFTTNRGVALGSVQRWGWWSGYCWRGVKQAKAL